MSHYPARRTRYRIILGETQDAYECPNFTQEFAPGPEGSSKINEGDLWRRSRWRSRLRCGLTLLSLGGFRVGHRGGKLYAGSIILMGFAVFAALLVVLVHAWLQVDPKGKIYEWLLYFDVGRIGVVAFFCISGFLIPFTVESLHSFLVRRASRILPAFWLSILITTPVLWLSDGRLFGIKTIALNYSNATAFSRR